MAQGVGGVNLAAELDGAWQRSRRRAIPGAGPAGGVRAGPAKVSQGPIKSVVTGGGEMRWSRGSPAWSRGAAPLRAEARLRGEIGAQGGAAGVKKGRAGNLGVRARGESRGNLGRRCGSAGKTELAAGPGPSAGRRARGRGDRLTCGVQSADG